MASDRPYRTFPSRKLFTLSRAGEGKQVRSDGEVVVSGGLMIKLLRLEVAVPWSAGRETLARVKGLGIEYREATHLLP